MPKSTRDIPSEDIQIPENTDPPKMAPESPLDDLAIQRARERYAAQVKREQLREWFIYQAPPGIYDMYVKEREALLEEHKQRMANAKWFLGFIVVVVVAIVGITFHDMWEVQQRLKP